MEFAVVFIVGVIFGVILAITTSYSRSVGSLRVDHSCPDEPPYLFLELTKNVDDFSRKKYVLLKINTQNLVSRK